MGSTNGIPKVGEIRRTILEMLAEEGPLPRKDRLGRIEDQLELSDEARGEFSGKSRRISKRCGQAAYDCRSAGWISVSESGKTKGQWKITKKGEKELARIQAVASRGEPDS